MLPFRSALATILSVAIAPWTNTMTANSNPPLGILTTAIDAHLNEAAAFAGLSVFEGERLSTGKEGRLSARVGGITLALPGESSATLHGIGEGAHVDLDAGAVVVSAAENSRVEVHVDDAMLRSEPGGVTQAQVRVLSAKMIEVVMRRGTLDFSYRDEFEPLKEGNTYRISLEDGAEAANAGANGGGTQRTGRLRSARYYILLGAAAVAAGSFAMVEGLHQNTSCQPESPASPGTCK